MSQLAAIPGLREKIRQFGKENLDEMLHALASGITTAAGECTVRIYLEDLTKGALSCAYATGINSQAISSTTFPIISSSILVSTAFVSQQIIEIRSFSTIYGSDRDFAEQFDITASTLFPITTYGKSLGVLCCDRDKSGAIFSGQDKSAIGELLVDIADRIDQARKYHQQLLLARQVDLYKKREAAGFMARSAVRLIDKLSLASVLVPSGDGSLVILASHSEDPQMKAEYDSLGAIGLEKGKSLISRYVDDSAVITDDKLLAPLSFLDLTKQPLQKSALTEKMALRSLYVVPRYSADTRRIICLVNYFTNEIYRFSDFEMGLLQTHAEMVERVIEEIGGEHLEVRVLSEISQMLQERSERVNPFLAKVLSKATELIGADTGSIAIVQEREDGKWLLVEDESGNIVGAKHKEWLKKFIPPFKVGGHELQPEERSLTGYCAWAKEAKIIGDIDTEKRDGGFHRSMHEEIKSEIAVPVICDDEVIAVICLNSLKPSYFTEEHKRILQIIESLTSRHLSDLQRIERLQNEVTRLNSDVAYKDPRISSYRLGNIIGNSSKAREIVDFINTVSPPIYNRINLWSKNVLQEATIGLPSILVLGQTGSGKEFFFNNLYNKLNSMYRDSVNSAGELPVKKTNIAAYSGELTYSELFGHKKGAFTGAYTDRKGILEEAGGGIVFLDEIGDADPKTQVQLLRFLDNGGFVRLGDNQQRYSRVLLVAATNKDLAEEIRKGNFREDLYHRLSELSVTVPSLNDRREDIPDLATHFMGKLYRTYRGDNEQRDTPPALSEEAKSALVNHQYKGNIRELRSLLLRALFFRSGNTISSADIRRAIKDGIWENPVMQLPDMNDQVAERIISDISAGADFWSAVYEPYTGNHISREVVKLVIEKARDRSGKSMPKIAAFLNAVDPATAGSKEEKLIFFRFKNFLYKTVRIS
ncbi:MAG: sigma 54-interacting transcriptional regulator [Geobacteraceae bacterium]|nr:sigma 54-interacting transcriptional regulator [Geobacteraceae bacterium]